jgi:hypothetical protein
MPLSLDAIFDLRHERARFQPAGITIHAASHIFAITGMLAFHGCTYAIAIFSHFADGISQALWLSAIED